MTNAICYVEGDATNPIGHGMKVIAHCCNDMGVWGKGFVMALSKRWPITKHMYLEWHRTGFCEGTPFQLGEVQLVAVEPSIIVANIIGQKGIRSFRNHKPIRYQSIRHAFERLCQVFGKEDNFSFHMPRIGCGLAGGKWSVMSEIIESTLVANGSVYVYDYKQRR